MPRGFLKTQIMRYESTAIVDPLAPGPGAGQEPADPGGHWPAGPGGAVGRLPGGAVRAGCQ
jgi:hypothetical protein